MESNTPCGYCFDAWATQWDHLVPVSWGGTDDTNNLYPTCARCNGILGGRPFSSIDEKREYVQEKLRETREQRLRKRQMRKTLLEIKKRSKVLQPSMSNTGMGYEKSKNKAQNR